MSVMPRLYEATHEQPLLRLRKNDRLGHRLNDPVHMPPTAHLSLCPFASGRGQGVEDSLQNQQRLLDEARSRRQTAEKVQASVKDDRKRFLAGTKELTDECYKYEALTAHLALMRR